MRLKARFVGLVIGSAVALGVVTWSTPGHAEKVKTNQSAKLLSRAGEQAPVVMKVKAGQTMTVLAKDGRWIKVRVSGRTGWLPRSKVDMPDDDEDVTRNTRRRPFVDGRSTKRGFGGDGGPDDRVGADAVGDDEPPKSSKGKPSDDEDERPVRKSNKRSTDEDKPAKRPPRHSKTDSEDEDDGDGDKQARGKDDEGDGERAEPKEDDRPKAYVAKRTAIYNDADKNSDESFTAEPKIPLYVLEEKGKWSLVTNEEGDTGYVLTSKLEVEDGGGGGGPRKRVLDVRGRLGVALISQRVATPGGMSTLPDNYTANSSSITIALGATVLYPYSKRYWIGGEFAYDYDNAVLGGISYEGKTTSFALHNFNLRAVGGYDLRTSTGMIAFGRLGYHYNSFQVGDVEDLTKNTAKIPSQIVSGPTLGGALAIPRLTKEIGVRVSLDALLFGGSMQQTKGLEDGTGPSAKAYFLGGSGTYRWKPRMDLQLTYDLAYTSIKFSGPVPDTSMRGHTAMVTPSGRDLNHTVSFGVVYAF